MTIAEVKKLRAEWKTIILKKYGYNSILGGVAVDVHHFIPSSRGIAFDFWLPNGIPLTREQHSILHSSDKRAEGYIEHINAVKGQQWDLDLKKRAIQFSTGAKDIQYNKVKDYLNNLSEDYI